MIKQFLRWIYRRLCRLPGFQSPVQSVISAYRLRRCRRYQFRNIKHSSHHAKGSRTRWPHRSSRRRALPEIPVWSPARSIGHSIDPSMAPSVSQSSRRIAHDPDRVVYSVSRSEIIDTLNNIYKGQTEGHLSEVRHSRGRVLRELELRGGDTSDTLDTIDDLANSAYLCECQGRYVEAERLYRQVLCLRQRHLDKDPLEVATSLDDLASLYCLRHRYDEAQPLLEQVLAIRQKHLTVPQKDLGDTLHKLAKTYRHQQEYGKAEPLFQRALDIFRVLLGSDHPTTQTVYTDLMQMIVATIEGGKFAELSSELPPLDLNHLSETYSWAKPSWQQSS